MMNIIISSYFYLITNFIPPFLLTHLFHLVSFHFIHPCDGATGVVSWHPCYSLTFSIGVSSHLIPWSSLIKIMMNIIISSYFFLITNFIPPFLLTHLFHLVSFHFIHPCYGATGMVSWHPCYSLTFNIGVSSHLIPRPDLVLGTSWGYL